MAFFFLKWKVVVLSVKETMFIVLQQKPDYYKSAIHFYRLSFSFFCIYKIATAVDIYNNFTQSFK